MAKDALQAIKTSEDQADRLLAQAREKAAQIVRQANEEASRTLARAREEAAQKVRALLTEAERKAAQDREAALRRIKEEEERLCALARQRLDQAASFIVEKVIGTYGRR